MKKFLIVFLTLLCCAGLVHSDDQTVEGRALAAELCAMAPIKDSAMTGTLIVKPDRKTEAAIPIEMKLVKKDEGWKSIYSTRDDAVKGPALLTIHQAPGKKNSYELTSGAIQEPRTISHNEAGVPFAGSDFWVSDLGLEFFRWRDQRVLTNVIRRGQACYVLESKNSHPLPGTYSKVVSWIDKDTLGIVRAEAYDHNGKLLKLFLPTKVRKVEGRYQIREVEMRNEQTGSKSVLQFDLETE